MNNPSPTNFLLLGASNLHFLWPALLSAIIPAHQPCTIHLASGIGRSFLKKAGLPWHRTLPLIGCGAFENFLTQSKTAPSIAFVMDMGNDFLYGFSPEQALSPLATILKKLQQANIQTIIIPPQATPDLLTEEKFLQIRSIYYPGSEISWQSVQQCLEVTKKWLINHQSEQCLLIENLTHLLSPDNIHYAPHKISLVLHEILARYTILTSLEYKTPTLIDSWRTYLQCATHLPYFYWIGKQGHARNATYPWKQHSTLTIY